MKRIIGIFMVVVIFFLTPINAFASADFVNIDDAEDGVELLENENNSLLTDLWIKGHDTYKLIYYSEDNREFISNFVVGNSTYQIEETVNEERNHINSVFYELSFDGKKTYLGNQETIFKEEDNILSIIVTENETIQSEEIIFTESSNDVENINMDGNNSIETASMVSYMWSYQGAVNGSNNITRYTTAAIINILAYAAGSPLAAGIATIATMIIGEQWSSVYWTKKTWVYLERCEDWPSYPNWIQGGKYRYHTKYYSDKNRTDLIGETEYVDGE